MAAALRLDVPQDVFARVVNQALRSCDPADWPQVLKHAGEEIGISVYSHHATLSEILPYLRPRTPWITGKVVSPGQEAFYIVKDKHGKKLDIERLALAAANLDAEERVPTAQFRREIYGDNPESLLLWVTAEAAAPLQTPHKFSAKLQYAAAGGHEARLDPISRLQILLKNDQTDIWVIIVYSLFIGILSLAVPIAVQLLINTFAFGNVFQPLVILSLFVFVALGFSTMLSALRKFMLELIQQRIFVRVSADTIYRLLRSRFDAFDKIYGPELLNRFFDVVTVQKGITSLFLEGLNMITQTLVGVVLLAFYHPYFLAFDILLLGSFAFILFGLGKNAVKTGIQESESKYQVAAWLQEIAGKLVTFKSGQASLYAIQHGDSLARGYLENRTKHFRIYFRQVVASLTIYVISLVTLLLVGGWLVMQSELSIGQLVAAELMLTTVVTAFLKFNKELEYYYDLIVGMEKIGHLTDIPLEKTGGESLPINHAPAHISVKNLTFHFQGQPVLFSHVNMEIAPGSRVGLTGNVGSGKTLLADCLYGLRTPETGTIEIDGIDFRSVNLSDLRRQIVLVRGNEIFHDSVLENIRLGSATVTMQDVSQALTRVGLLEDIRCLPQGLNTVLKTGGAPLRLSQIARLMIARAILAEPRFLIVDELLDLIDDSAEQTAIFETLFMEKNPWTMLVVSKSRRVLSYCDYVYHLDHGEIFRYNKANEIAVLSNVEEAG
jgi:ABC-type bacteriocin/lantibiotic exporter with double-glycine peptidase domain